MEYGFESSPESTSPEPIEFDLPEPVEIDSPEVVGPDIYEPTVSDLPKPVELDLSDEVVEPEIYEPIEPDLLEQIESGLSEPVEPDYVETVDPEITESAEPDYAESEYAEPVEPDYIEPTEPTEIESPEPVEPEGTPNIWEQPNVPGVVGHEETGIYHSPETVAEKEPGSGPKPSFDQPPEDPPLGRDSESNQQVTESAESSPGIWPSPSRNPEIEPTPEPKGDSPPSPSTLPPGGWPTDDPPPPPAPTDISSNVSSPTDEPMTREGDIAIKSDNDEAIPVLDVEGQQLIDELQKSREEQEAQMKADAEALTDRPRPAYMDVETEDSTPADLESQSVSEIEPSAPLVDDASLIDDGKEGTAENLSDQEGWSGVADELNANDTVDAANTFSEQQESGSDNTLIEEDDLQSPAGTPDLQEEQIDNAEFFKEYNAYLQDQGRMNEDSTRSLIGGDAVILDDTAGTGHGGGRYPTFDISSSGELTSVKSHLGENDEIGKSQVNNYVTDFHHMLGWGRAFEDGLEPIEQDARNIVAARDAGIPVPSELLDASNEQVVDYLRNNTVLRVPDDHVDTIRTSLDSKIREIPSNYFLPDNPTEDQIQGILNRVQGTGLTSQQIHGRLRQL